MVSDPAQYRWSGHGEACGGGTKGDFKRAREMGFRLELAGDEIGYGADDVHHHEVTKNLADQRIPRDLAWLRMSSK